MGIDKRYWKHLFSRYKLRGDWITWCFNLKPGWFRIGKLIFRWEI